MRVLLDCRYLPASVSDIMRVAVTGKNKDLPNPVSWLSGFLNESDVFVLHSLKWTCVLL